MITLDQYSNCLPYAKGKDVMESYPFISKTMERFDITVGLRAAMFIAQMAHESNNLTARSENLNYSKERLLQIFPSYFKPAILAEAYERKPKMIANRVYANRMGNGGEATGDGWRHRGAGYFQLTGKENQTKCGLYFNVAHPEEWLRTIEGASLSAGWFWFTKGLNAIADKNEFLKASVRINGVAKIVVENINGLPTKVSYPHGWEDRQAKFNICKKALNII